VEAFKPKDPSPSTGAPLKTIRLLGGQLAESYTFTQDTAVLAKGVPSGVPAR